MAHHDEPGEDWTYFARHSTAPDEHGRVRVQVYVAGAFVDVGTFSRPSDVAPAFVAVAGTFGGAS